MFIRIDHRTLVESKGRTEKQCKSDYYQKMNFRKLLNIPVQEYMNILCDRKNEIKLQLTDPMVVDREQLENELIEIINELQKDQNEILAL